MFKMNLLRIITIILTAFWLYACAHTDSPAPVKPEKEKTSENTVKNQTSSSGDTESKSKESKEKTRAEQPLSQDESAVESQEAAKQQQVRKGPQTSQSTPEPVTGSNPEDSSENTAKTRPTASDPAEAQLAEAREKLKTSRDTEKRIASNLERLKKSGDASAEAIEDYEAYLARVRAMTAENRKVVEQMEAAYDRHTPGETKSNSPVSNKTDEIYEPNIPEDQTVDGVAALDREFNESLAKFDDRLLKEMDAIRAESAKKLQDLAQEAADAAKRLRDKGVDVDTSESESSQEGDSQKETSEMGGETGSAKDKAKTETDSGDKSRKAEKGASTDNRRRTDYEDDDIVARQLREAAENETDPELKKKLWKEYEEYKKSR